MHEAAAGGTARKVVEGLGGFFGAFAPDIGAKVFAVGALGEHGRDHRGLHTLEGLGGFVREAAAAFFVSTRGGGSLVNDGLRPQGAVVVGVKGTWIKNQNEKH